MCYDRDALNVHKDMVQKLVTLLLVIVGGLKRQRCDFWDRDT